MNQLAEALAKHGTAVKAVLAEDFEHWPIEQAMTLIAQMAREIAAAELKRQGQR